MAREPYNQAMRHPASHNGILPSGSRYRIEVPAGWNGIALLTCRPLPVGPHDPPWDEPEPLLRALLEAGYALAGSANTIFWPLEQAFASQPLLLDAFDDLVGHPDGVIAWGPSIGGIMTAGLVQLMPDRLSGALPLCGNLAGAVANHNRELDIAFVLKTLLAPGAPLQVVGIDDPDANLAVAMTMLTEAEASPAGRARLALAAAVGNIPGWFSPLSPEPPARAFDDRLSSQISWYREPGFLVYFLLRAQIERQAGGNPSGNEAVSYRQLFGNSIGRAQVEALYLQARLDLDADLLALQDASRIMADRHAVEYLERHIVFNGELAGLPVLTVHTTGDGLVPPCNERAYADVVNWAGGSHLLRQLFVSRGGHCSFTAAEVLTALSTLRSRIEGGTWGDVTPAAMNDAAMAMGEAFGMLPSGDRAEPGFAHFDPPGFPRAYDVRSTYSDGRKAPP